ncbi:MAG: hypothetical protein R3F39_25315 [Myxococcota bacterium]
MCTVVILATMARHTTIAALAAVLALGACTSAQAPAEADVAPGPSHVTASDLEDGLRAQVPADLVIHSHHQAIEATAPDGSFRVFVGREADEPLIKLAGPAKDALVALGWVVEGEQHYEHALFIALRRGGTRDAPKERRQTWWVRRAEGSYVCDAIAAAGSYRRLGTPHRALCQRIELAQTAPAAAAPTADSEPVTGGSEAP